MYVVDMTQFLAILVSVPPGCPSASSPHPTPPLLLLPSHLLLLMSPLPDQPQSLPPSPPFPLGEIECFEETISTLKRERWDEQSSQQMNLNQEEMNPD